jgi:excinuclease UvrABC nuclease subunit
MIELTKANIKAVSANSGIYRIIWGRSGKAVPIQRMLKKDANGILYIGRSKNLRSRLNQFYNVAFANSNNHSGGMKYRTRKYIEIVLQNEVYFEFEYHDDYANQENIALGHGYQRIYGETPPLNG